MPNALMTFPVTSVTEVNAGTVTVDLTREPYTHEGYAQITKYNFMTAEAALKYGLIDKILERNNIVTSGK